MEDEQSHSDSTQKTGTAPSLWNPTALANWSLLLTPLFGSYLLAENYKAMGKPKEAKKAMEWLYVGIAIFLSAFLLSPFGLFGVALLIYLVYLVSWNFMAARKQQRAVLLAYGKSYERQPWGKVLVIGIAAIIVWQTIVRGVTSPLFLTASFDSAEVKQVKSGVMQLCPSHTVDQMVKGFMGAPSWKSGKSTDGKVFVNVEGDITFQDKPVRAMVQFIVEGESFSFRAFEMNGVPSANLIAISLLNKMCASAEGNVAEKTAILPQPASAKSNAIEVQQPAQVSSPLTNISSLVGQHPESALDDPALKEKFKMLLGDNLGGFRERLNTASGMTQEKEWLVGQGGMPHLFSIEEAAFAINTKTSEIFAIMLIEGKDINWFGATDVTNLPAPLQSWYKDHGGN